MVEFDYLVNQIEGCMCDELIQMTMVIFLCGKFNGNK